MKHLKHIANFLILNVFFMLPAVASATTPTISSVSGTVATGQTLTVSGTNMVDEDRTNWDGFFTSHPNASGFEGATPIADGYSAIGPDAGVYASDVKLLGGKSMRFDISGEATDLVNQHFSGNAFVQNQGENMWLRGYARWHAYSGGWPSSHLKMIIVDGGYYFQPQVQGIGSGNPTSFYTGLVF